MRSILTAAAIATTLATPSAAGNLAPAPVDPVVIVEDTSSSSQAILVNVLTIILFAAMLD
ncbi:hypothetical protein [uncultured Jannaschia sp.]|uniref:hypothetical protein n=1 Tax=uncultured Jannaschia sp. TaxID=293347 RepID=UPI002638C071|nr:hypothetical protein [uncultured Jannaschia sp.]